MSRIFWDTNIFIYLFEDFGSLSKKTITLRHRMTERGDQLLTSSMTLGEILVKPLQKNDHTACRQYEKAIARAAVIIPFDINAARAYARLRATRSLKAPDALQLSCAGSVGVDLFVTNDDRLQRVQVPGIQFIASLDRVPL